MKKITLILLLVLFASFAYAIEITQDSLDVSVIPDFNQPGKVQLTLSGTEPGEYNLYTLTAVKLLPTAPFHLNGGDNSLAVDVYPTDELAVNTPIAYSFVFNLRRIESETTYEGKMSVRVVRFEDAFSLSSDPNSPDSDKITFYLKNRETIDLKNIHAKFSSIFFDSEQTFDIKANEKKEFSISVDRDKLKRIEAGSYVLTAEVQTDRGVKTLEGRILLGEKKGIETKTETNGFFIRTNIITKTNYGNVQENVSIELRKNVFNRLFTSFNIQPDTITRNGLRVSYSWSKRLMPADALEVKARANYILPLLILIVIALIIIGFKRYTEAKIEIEKSVVPIRTKNGQFALKIKLHLKARKFIKNVSVVDRIPGILQVYEKFSSNIKPSKIDVKNRRLQWDFGDMTSGEERVFSYMVYSSVGVVGKFALPQALAVFEKDGQIHETESNNVYFLAEQRAQDE